MFEWSDTAKLLRRSFLIIFVLAVAYFAKDIIRSFFDGVMSLEPNVYVPLSVTFFTAVGGLYATLSTQAKTRRLGIEAAFRERKIEIYLGFLKQIEAMQLAQKKEFNFAEPSQKDLVASVFDVRTKAMLWGSTGVINALSEFTKVSSENPMRTFRVLEEIQREMRLDLGLSNKGLEKDFPIKMLLNDPDEIEKLKRGEH